MFEVIDATVEHAHAIAPHMRAGDVAEVEAMGSTPLAALLEGLASSLFCKTLVVDGEPAMLYGIVQLASDMWSPWALGTDAISRERRAFLEYSREEIERVSTLYPVLYNQVDHRNHNAIQWLKWLGFEVLAPVPAGINDELFHPFILRAA